MNALDVMKYGHLTVLRAVDGLSDGQWVEPGVCGIWSTREIIAHLASYELVLAEVLQGLAAGGQTPLLDELITAGAGFNDTQVDRRRGQTCTQTLDEYRSAYEQVAASGMRLPEDIWRQAGVIPWYGAEYSLDDLIAYQYYGHKREHCAQIDVYRDRLGRAAAGRSAATAT